MIVKLMAGTLIAFFSTVVTAADLPDSSQLPRMPDAYRNSDYKNLSKRNPYGMSVFDIAEREAEEDIFGSEVVSIEESKKILSERKKKKEKERKKTRE